MNLLLLPPQNPEKFPKVNSSLFYPTVSNIDSKGELFRILPTVHFERLLSRLRLDLILNP